MVWIRASGRRPSLLGDLAAGDQDRGAAVGQRRGVAGRDLPIDLREAGFHRLAVERRLQPGQRLHRRAGPDDLVGAQPGDRDQLVVEESVLGGAGGLFVAGGGELVELGAREAPLRGDQFGADALWHQAFGVAPGHVLAERVAAGQHRAAHRDAAHRLHAAGDDEVVGAGERRPGRRS